jgi:flagellar M-ring protein FliF
MISILTQDRTASCFHATWDAKLREQLQNILLGLKAVGTRRLIGLGAILIVLLAGIGVSAVILNKPAFETLYVGLDRDDVNRVGLALSEAGFVFDVDSSGSSVLVEAGSASKARMVLAEKGLPASSGAGYELFDNLGSLGLTSFMQEITRVRALEGEIARSIQAIDGVKAARVHIVLPDRSAFRDRDRKPTASIIIKSDKNQIVAKAFAMRHLVAAAIPGLASEDVTIMDSTGTLLASGQDKFSNALSGSLDMQRTVESDIEQKIGSALGPQLGAMNYRISVQAQIDTDRSQIQETVFDPASKVERSIQVVKAEDSSTQKPDSKNISVEQNLPKQQDAAAAGPLSAEKSQKREETTNFEISSKRTDTEKNGYRLEKMAISIVLNKKKITELLGANAAQSDLDARVSEIQKVASAAAGYDEGRGDKINVSALDFIDEELLPSNSAGIFDGISKYAGTAMNALSFLIVSVLVLIFGIRPLIKAIAVNPDHKNAASVDSQDYAALDGRADGSADSINRNIQTEISNLKQAYLQKTKITPSERIKAMAELDPERTARVLRKWLVEDAA